MSNFTEEEVREFVTEAEDLLDQAEKSLLALDGGAELSAHYDAIFRVFHSLKGAAGMMEITPLQTHMHKLENTFLDQKGKATIAKAYVDYFLRGSDAARKLLANQPIDFQYDIDDAAAPKPVAVETPAPTPPAKKIAPKGRALVIDDEPELVDLMVGILNGAGFEARGIGQPKEALKNVREFQPDVILTDISMPEMSGLEVLAQMKEKHPDIPVVIVSGYVDKNSLLEMIQNGAHGVIEKPFDVLDIIGVAVSAAQQHKLAKTLNSSINLMMYQFSDLKEFLIAQNKHDVVKVIEQEMHSLLNQRRQLRKQS